MKFCEKKIVFGIVLFFGILLSYNLYFQYKKSLESIELISESDSVTSSFFSDLELPDNGQITSQIIFLDGIEKNTTHNYFHISCRFAQPFLTLWQPPKLG